jgi:hypothetical protein
VLTFFAIDFMTAIVGVTTDFAKQLKEILSNFKV